MLHLRARARRLVTGSSTACRVDFVFPRRRLTDLRRKPRVLRSGLRRQGKTSVVTVVSGQTGYSIRRSFVHAPDETVTAPAVSHGVQPPAPANDVRRPLVSASHIIQAGNDLFTGKDEACIMNRKKEEKSMLRKGRECARA